MAGAAAGGWVCGRGGCGVGNYCTCAAGHPNPSKGTCQSTAARPRSDQCDNETMTNTFEPHRFAYAYRPGHTGDPNVPTRDLTLIRPGHVVFTYPASFCDERAQRFLNEVLRHIAGGRTILREYNSACLATIEITDTHVIARDFDGNPFRQNFHCHAGTITYNGNGIDGPITPGENDTADYIIESWA